MTSGKPSFALDGGRWGRHLSDAARDQALRVAVVFSVAFNALNLLSWQSVDDRIWLEADSSGPDLTCLCARSKRSAPAFERAGRELVH
jgi:hypothetical protein